MSKRLISKITAFTLAGFAVLGGFILQGRAEAEGLKRQVELGYQRAFSELASASDQLSKSLSKCVCFESAGAFSSVCAEAYAKAGAAQRALGALPFSGAELTETASFFSKAGDYAWVMAKKSASGQALSEEERRNLSALAAGAELLSDNLEELYAGLRNGEVTFEAAENLASEASATLADGFVSMESEFPELPTLVYDGPFSDHLTDRSPAFLENAPEITKEEAVKRAADFTGMAEERFTVEYERGGAIPVYVLSARSLHGSLIVEVSVAGGVVTRLKNTRTAGESIMTVEDGVAIAEKFLASHGYDGMEKSYYHIEDGAVTVNFACTQEGVTCYPDLAKVTVALDTGRVVGFESEGYVMSHRERELSEPKVTQEDAEGRVSENLTVLSRGLAVIETGGKNEVMCHEFKCEGADKRHYILYVNTETGQEEKLLMLIEDENGTMTV